MCPPAHVHRRRLDACVCPKPDPSPPLQPLLHSALPPPQVVHCRRVLKWTYAIAYYTFEETVGGLACLVVVLL